MPSGPRCGSVLSTGGKSWRVYEAAGQHRTTGTLRERVNLAEAEFGQAALLQPTQQECLIRNKPKSICIVIVSHIVVHRQRAVKGNRYVFMFHTIPFVYRQVTS